jgi:flagellin
MAELGISGILGNIISRDMLQTQLQLLEPLERSTTTPRIGSAADNYSSYSMTARIEAQQREAAVGERNIQLGIAMFNAVEGYLSSITEDISQIRELTMQAADSALSDTARTEIQEEIESLTENISNTLSTAEFNDVNLFSGYSETFQVGPNPSNQISLNLPSISIESLGLGAIDITSQAGTDTAITSVSSALEDVLAAQTDIGVMQFDLNSSLNSLTNLPLSTQQASNELSNFEMALEILNASRALTNSQSYALINAQSNNLESDMVITLLE